MNRDGRSTIDAHEEIREIRSQILPLLTTINDLRNPGNWFDTPNVLPGIADNFGNVYVAGGTAEVFAMAFSAKVEDQFAQANFIGLATDHAGLEVARFFSIALTQDWASNLYKVFEVICLDVGEWFHGQPSTSANARLHAQRRGKSHIDQRLRWTTSEQIKNFEGAVHRPGVSGDDARHGTDTRELPANPMDRLAAIEFIRDLIRIWQIWRPTR